MPETLKLTPHETVTIRSASPELLDVEGRWGPGGKPPPAHYHPEQDEHFEVLEGTLTAKLNGEERDLRPGETLAIPRRTPHQIWNRGQVEARAIWQTRPALRTENWFRSIDRLFREGRVGKNGMPGPLALRRLPDRVPGRVPAGEPAGSHRTSAACRPRPIRSRAGLPAVIEVAVLTFR
jgi:mannose-6-phosphate isomerase-like protein (cupin superfamily)